MLDAKINAPEFSGPMCAPLPNLSRSGIVIMPPVGPATHPPTWRDGVLEYHPAADAWICSRMASPKNKCLIEQAIPELPKWK